MRPVQDVANTVPISTTTLFSYSGDVHFLQLIHEGLEDLIPLLLPNSQEDICTVFSPLSLLLMHLWRNIDCLRSILPRWTCLMSHCTLYIALAQSTHRCCAQLQDQHIPRWTCLIAHCTCHGGQSRKYINSSYCTVNITLQNVSLHMPRWKAHIASWTY